MLPASEKETCHFAVPRMWWRTAAATAAAATKVRVIPNRAA